MKTPICSLVPLVALFLLVACTRTPKSLELPQIFAGSPSTSANAVPTGEQFLCPVTPYAEERPPDSHTASFTETWYGNDVLWAGLSPAYGGRWYAGAKGLKVLWYRAVAGELTVEGKRLDAAAPALQADIPAGYGNSGYQSSSLIFPSAGCWEVVGRVADKELRFVVNVHPAQAHPSE